MQAFVIFDSNGAVAISAEAQWNEHGEIIAPERYEGPFEVPEGFFIEQHLYRKKDGALEKDAGMAAKYRRDSAIMAALSKRRQLLDGSDYLLMPDYPLADDKRAAAIVYRQALRDITDQPGYPEEIQWPKLSI